MGAAAALVGAGGILMTVRDLRNAGWCWQEKATLDVLRAYYDGERLKQRSTALAIYLVLTEIASDQRTPERAEVTHRAIWEHTGTSASTVKRYLAEFEQLGVLAVERRKAAGDVSLPNVYALLTPRSTDGPTPAIAPAQPRSTSEPTPPADGPQLKERSLNNGNEEAVSTHQNNGETSAQRIARLRRAVR